MSHKIKKSDIIIALFSVLLFLFHSPVFVALKSIALLRFFLAFAASSNFLKVPIWICFLSTVIYALYLSRHADTPVIPVPEFLFFRRPNPAYITDSPCFCTSLDIFCPNFLLSFCFLTWWSLRRQPQDKDLPFFKMLCFMTLSAPQMHRQRNLSPSLSIIAQ